MAMGETGMAGMSEMEMPLPENTLPMMTGQGQFGAIDMGGMFTTVKVRKGLAKGDYRDPGNYQFPSATLAYEFTGALPEATRPKAQDELPGIELDVRKPSGHSGH